MRGSWLTSWQKTKILPNFVIWIWLLNISIHLGSLLNIKSRLIPFIWWWVCKCDKADIAVKEDKARVVQLLPTLLCNTFLKLLKRLNTVLYKWFIAAKLYSVSKWEFNTRKENRTRCFHGWNGGQHSLHSMMRSTCCTNLGTIVAFLPTNFHSSDEC